MANFEKLTIKSAEALQAARALALRRENPVVNDAHLLAALLEQDEGIVAPLLGKVGVNVTGLKADVEREIGRFPKQSGGVEPQFSREVTQALDRAEAEARKLGDDYVSTEHLLVGLFDTKGTAARTLLSAAGVAADDLRGALTAVRGAHRVTDQSPEDQYQALKRFTRDLTDAARAGKLDPVIGRDDEVRRVIQVLSRRTGRGSAVESASGEGSRHDDKPRRAVVPVQRERLADAALGHHRETHGVGERQIQVVEPGEPLTHGARLEVGRAGDHHVRRPADRPHEGQRGGAVHSPQYEGVALRQHEVGRDHASPLAHPFPQHLGEGGMVGVPAINQRVPGAGVHEHFSGHVAVPAACAVPAALVPRAGHLAPCPRETGRAPAPRRSPPPSVGCPPPPPSR
jgi:hypothetical protein